MLLKIGYLGDKVKVAYSRLRKQCILYVIKSCREIDFDSEHVLKRIYINHDNERLFEEEAYLSNSQILSWFCSSILRSF